MGKIKRRLKFAWQKLTRGFSDDELWNLDATIAAFIAPRLRRFKDITYSYPASFTEEEWDEQIERWIWAFHLVASDVDEFDMPLTQRAEMRRAFKEFGDYYRGLWS